MSKSSSRRKKSWLSSQVLTSLSVSNAYNFGQKTSFLPITPSAPLSSEADMAEEECYVKFKGLMDSLKQMKEKKWYTV